MHRKKPIQLGIVMDPIEQIKQKKDSTLAMLLAAQRRNCELHYMRKQDLYLSDGRARATSRPLRVFDDAVRWFETGQYVDHDLSELDIILMRVDPPYNMEYIYCTHLLERAEAAGVMVTNRPSALRLVNEKLFISWFSGFTPPTLVSSQQSRLAQFLQEHQDIVVKPLDGMGGNSVFRVQQNDQNASVIFETISANNTQSVMAQRFIPEISAGDKRILMINGEPVPYALARIPAIGELRGNLAAGGRGEGCELSPQDQAICAAVGPKLRELGIAFAGLDVIGDYLTEINVTSPTCIRELDAIYGLDIAGDLLDHLLQSLKNREP